MPDLEPEEMPEAFQMEEDRPGPAIAGCLIASMGVGACLLGAALYYGIKWLDGYYG